MKRFSVVILALIFAISAAFAADAPRSPKLHQGHVDRLITGNEDVKIPADAVRDYSPRYHELDEIVGDTVHVGYTFWESQHNGTVGRMIGFYPDEYEIDGQLVNNVAFMVWTCLEEAGEASTRHVRFNRVGWTDEGPYVEHTDGVCNVDVSARAGYTTFGFDAVNGLPFPSYHAMNQGATGVDSRMAAEISGFHNVFNEATAPQYQDNENIWPHVAYAEYNGTGYLHMVTNENREDPVGQMDLLYSRHEFDAAQDRFIPAESQVLITDEQMNICADIGVSEDGSLVAIATTVSRDYLYHPELDPSQWNNDIYLWLSHDGGETWDDPVNVTDFALPDENELPDLEAANKDTMRAYTDVNVYIDADNTVHLAFTTPFFYFYSEDSETGEIGPIRGSTRTAMLYHWDSESNNFTLLANGDFWNYAVPGAWQRSVNRPSMYQDPVSGILYCVFQQYGMPGENTYVDEETFWGWDASDDWYANGEIMVTMSPPSNANGDWYGQLWTKPVNITNTRNHAESIEELAAAGDCMNEREPSVALHNDGEYLHIFYIYDQDAGFVVQEEGEFTNNPAVYHRVAKADLIQIASDTAAWLPNVSMHYDTTNSHWWDPYDYAWEHEDWADGDPFFRGEGGGHDKVDRYSELAPHEFALDQNYPNPFNPTTHIGFSLERKGTVKLAVYDVLGREVTTILNRVMNNGRHTAVFDGSDLASGIYFVKLSSGEAVKTMKMVLMK